MTYKESKEGLAWELIECEKPIKRSDCKPVVKELTKFPKYFLKALRDTYHFKIVVIANNVASHFTHLKNARPSGWPLNSTFKDVQGVFDPNDGKAYISLTKKKGKWTLDKNRGTYNVVLHETAHGLDYFFDLSTKKKFKKIRQKDIASLNDYEKQRGNRGLEETFAEGLARLYGGDNMLALDWPNLFQYFLHLDF